MLILFLSRRYCCGGTANSCGKRVHQKKQKVLLWWNWWGLRDQSLDFFTYLARIAQPLLLFLTTAVALPSSGARMDLRERYYSTRWWFFGFIIPYPLIGLILTALNPNDSIALSKVAACAIAAHVMEVGVFKGDPDARRTAFARIREMREELDDMFTQAQSMSVEAHTS